jgi:CRISPR/Cas system-associated exonuclease Cas4 (RecB family)
MLSEAVIAIYAKKKSSRRPNFTVSSMSPCPYEVWLTLNRTKPREFSGEDRLRLEDGHWQEEQMLSQLKEAGYSMRSIGKNQMEVTVGPESIIGHPDGLIVASYRNSNLHGLEIKAMSLERFTRMTKFGLESEPRIKCQIQCYMHSDQWRRLEVPGTFVYYKHKDTCRPRDLYEEYNPDFIEPILEAVAKIRGGEVEPKAEESEYCNSCFKRQECKVGSTVLPDMTTTDMQSDPELVEKWRQGKYYSTMGKDLMEEAREVIVQRLGDNTLLMLDELKVLKYSSKRLSIPVDKFIQVFGPDKLGDVVEEKEIESIRITDTLAQ